MAAIERVLEATRELRKRSGIWQAPSTPTAFWTVAIPPEACYLGWQESLILLAKLVEPETAD